MVDKKIKEFFRKLGYKSLTPIQERTIPAVLTGRDVLAMGRTGSGKTLSYMYPLLEMLKHRFNMAGESRSSVIRAIIICPSRELAHQVFCVSRKVIKAMKLESTFKSICLIGGENIDNQYNALSTNPDIIVATPGRLWQLLTEEKDQVKKRLKKTDKANTSINLNGLFMCVLDEADKLIQDKALWQQSKDILFHLPLNTQKCLFSATLPKNLQEFTSVSLNSPLNVKVDDDVTLSPNLTLYFYYTRSEMKEATLLWLIQKLLSKGSRTNLATDTLAEEQVCKKKNPKTIIYTSTKHHVEYLKTLLDRFGISCSYLYGEMDHAYRKQMMNLFRTSPTTPIMIVTDVASRGLDISGLENVINYDMPAEGKIFVHRVGRVARQDNHGTAYFPHYTIRPSISL